MEYTFASTYQPEPPLDVLSEGKFTATAGENERGGTRRLHQTGELPAVNHVEPRLGYENTSDAQRTLEPEDTLPDHLDNNK